MQIKIFYTKNTAEPDKLFDEYGSNDVSFSKLIHDNGDNLRDFEIEDADGYVLFSDDPIYNTQLLADTLIFACTDFCFDE